MLVLSRKLDQSIQIGDQITVTVVSVKGNTVRLGISAPDHIRVARSELAAKSAGTPDKSSVSNSAPIFELESKPNSPVTFGLRGQGKAPAKSLETLFPANDYQVHHFRLSVDKEAIEVEPQSDRVQQV